MAHGVLCLEGRQNVRWIGDMVCGLGYFAELHEVRKSGLINLFKTLNIIELLMHVYACVFLFKSF